MLKLRDGIVELYRKVATSLPPDVREAMESGLAREPEGSIAFSTMSVQIENMKLARETAKACMPGYRGPYLLGEGPGRAQPY